MRTRLFLAATLLGLLTLAVYWAGLAGAFFFDDGPSILQAPGVRMTEFSWETLGQAWVSGGAGPTGRPVAQLSFALNHYFSGYMPYAYKASNLAIHGLCALVVYQIVRQLFKSPPETASQAVSVWMAVAVAAVWMLHPIQLLAVLHVVQRMTSLSALFLLTAFCLHMMGREKGGQQGWILLVLAWALMWPLSILSKETGALLPVFVLAWEVFVRRVAAGRLDRFARAYLVVLLLLAVCVVLYLVSARAQWLWAGYEFRPFTLGQRLLTEARVIWFYLGLALLPRWSAFGLYHDDITVSSDWLTPWTTLPAVLGLVALLVLMWRVRVRLPLLAFGLAWFLAGHLMESTVLPLELAHEHRNYLPLLGVVLAVGGLLRLGLARQFIKPVAASVVCVVAVISLSLITTMRAHQYGEEIRRTLGEALNHPASPRAQNEAGLNLANLAAAADAGSIVHQSARNYFERASQLDRSFKMGLLGLIELDCKAGLAVNAGNVAELGQRLGQTLFAPGDRNVLYMLKQMSIAGELCLKRDDVERLFAAAISNPGVAPPVQAMLYSWLADYRWLKERDLPAAAEALRASLRLNGESVSTRLKWAQLVWLSGDRSAARVQLLALPGARLTAEESNTVNELLAADNISRP